MAGLPPDGVTCESCVYFVRGPIDPMNLMAPIKGACRRFPPTTVILPMLSSNPMTKQPQAIGQIESICYPQITIGVVPPCGEHLPKKPAAEK